MSSHHHSHDPFDLDDPMSMMGMAMVGMALQEMAEQEEHERRRYRPPYRFQPRLTARDGLVVVLVVVAAVVVLCLLLAFAGAAG